VQMFKMYFLFFHTKSPSSLCHHREALPCDRYLGSLYTVSKEIRGPYPKKSAAKNMQNFGQFYKTSNLDREYLLSETSQDIQNQKDM